MISDYAQLIDALRDRAVEMQISRFDIDDIAGLTGGHAGKLLSSQPSKTFGPKSMGPMLKVLGLRIVLVEDTGLTKATESSRTPVDQSNQRFGNKCNSKHRPNVESVAEIPRIAPAPPALESRAHLRVVQGRRGGKYG
jgi:hypothetical protein